MPTYKNTTDRVISISMEAGRALNPGQELALNYYLPYRQLGLSLVDDLPKVISNDRHRYDFAEFILTGDQEIIYEIPYAPVVSVEVGLYEGACQMYIADSPVPFRLSGSGCKFHANMLWSLSAQLRFVASSATPSPTQGGTGTANPVGASVWVMALPCETAVRHINSAR